ncbi:hypothetical protein ABPG75_004275 [Micractinium tetrahymenae]
MLGAAEPAEPAVEARQEAPAQQAEQPQAAVPTTAGAWEEALAAPAQAEQAPAAAAPTTAGAWEEALAARAALARAVGKGLDWLFVSLIWAALSAAHLARCLMSRLAARLRGAAAGVSTGLALLRRGTAAAVQGMAAIQAKAAGAGRSLFKAGLGWLMQPAPTFEEVTWGQLLAGAAACSLALAAAYKAEPAVLSAAQQQQQATVATPSSPAALDASPASNATRPAHTTNADTDTGSQEAATPGAVWRRWRGAVSAAAEMASARLDSWPASPARFIAYVPVVGAGLIGGHVGSLLAWRAAAAAWRAARG